MDPLEPPPHADHALAPDGEAFVWQVRPGLVVQRASGIFTMPLARCFTTFFASVFEPGKRCTFFADFEQLTLYTGEAREHMNAFALAHTAEMGVVHFLISSKFVALGLSTFKAEIGDEYVRVYSDRASFLRSFEEQRRAAA